MRSETKVPPSKPQPSVVQGSALDEVLEGKGQTIAAFAREVTRRWGDQDALVSRTASGTVRWSYNDLWDRSMEIARALAANDVGKGCRVGILMSNRPEFIASVFGIALAGGVVVALNTFATPAELDALLKASEIELLLFESSIAKKDYSAVLRELEPAIDNTRGDKLLSLRYPFCAFSFQWKIIPPCSLTCCWTGIVSCAGERESHPH